MGSNGLHKGGGVGEGQCGVEGGVRGVYSHYFNECIGWFTKR